MLAGLGFTPHDGPKRGAPKGHGKKKKGNKDRRSVAQWKLSEFDWNKRKGKLKMKQ